MEKVLFLFVLFAGCCSASNEDLSGKMFVFPRRSSTDYVKLEPNNANTGLKAMTVCLRFFSDDKDTQTLFSMATKHSDNSPLLYKYADRYEVFMMVFRSPLIFWGLPNKLDQWHSYCFTWDSKIKLVQLWVDEVRGTKKFAEYGVEIKEKPSIILGQDQDNYGGKFSFWESFHGQIKDVHVWDYVISDCEIKKFTKQSTFKGGNVINWNSLNYTIGDKVLVEKDEKCQKN